MTDPVFLITGASAGIGAATARHAVDAGYRVVLAARRADRLAALAEELGGSRHALAVPCDVTDWAQVSAMIERVRAEFGRVDVAFANAGVSVGGTFLGGQADPDDWREMVLANVYGPAITARAALPALVETRGHLLFTGSGAGRGVRPGNLYSATKWALTGMAQNIRAECVGTGVRVTIVQPGQVATDMQLGNRTDAPMLSADDVARAVMYAVAQPPAVDVNEIVLRPTGQDPHR